MKKYYKKFLDAHQGKIHLAAHSHHFWPDVSLEGQTQYWHDSARYSDKKWEYFLGEKLQEVQSLISNILSFDRPDDIAFAPNTHELLFRLFSCYFDNKTPIKVLTTNCEFHSFSRQLQGLEQAKMVTATRLDPEAANFEETFLKEAMQSDFIFISQVFFNSGQVTSAEFLAKLAKQTPNETLICVDGYHGFCAIPTNLSQLGDRIFYLAGGYKYAQAGEGMCFLTLPKNCQLKPIYTGWFANYQGLEEQVAKKELQYSSGGMRFWGSTQDLSSHYRFAAVWQLFKNEKIDVKKIDHDVKSLQQYFIEKLSLSDQLLHTDINKLGHFLTFEFQDTTKCQKASAFLEQQGILSDYRGSRLRLGFGPYIDQADIEQGLQVLNSKRFQLLAN